MEKKILGATIVIVAVVIAAAAATVVVYSSDDDNDLSAYSADVQIPEGASTAVIYFTWSGHAETIAGYIENVTGDTAVEIVPETAYPTDYDSVVEQVQEEVDSGARPTIDADSLSSALTAMNGADYIFLGYPTWYANCPMIILSLIDEYKEAHNDLADKTIIPFCTSGSSSPDTGYESIRNESGATVTDGYWCTTAHADAGIEDEVYEWLAAIGLEKSS